MKNLLFAVLIAAFIMPAMQGCKKGAEDPGISLRSRNSRLYGTWKLNNMENIVISYNYSIDKTNDVNEDVVKETGNVSTTLSSSSGTSISQTTSTNYSGTETHSEWSGTAFVDSDNEETYTNSESKSYSVSYEISIYKDGTYLFTRTKNQTTESWDWDLSLSGDQADPLNNQDFDDKDTDGSTYKDDVTSWGTWQWDDYGPKEGKKRVKLYAGILSGYLVRLSNKEIKLDPGVDGWGGFFNDFMGIDNSGLFSFSYSPDYSGLYGFSGYSYSGSSSNASVDRSRTVKTDVFNYLIYSNTSPGSMADGVETEVITEQLTTKGGISTWERTDNEKKRE